MIGNPSYDRRKAEKQAIYRTSKVPVIEWDTRRPYATFLNTPLPRYSWA